MCGTKLEDRIGSDFAAGSLYKPIEDGSRGSSMKLLKDNRSREGAECWLVILHRVRTYALNDHSQDWISGSQVRERLIV
ncbi:MAG TPA: hypothetical protein VKH81_23570 [Candidatus Angelobacter sp.]|nr:hypothetical protein [Candidatus Angelobacter sp.]